ncbi:lactate racemase domain-containing protein [Actinoallomurus sp. NPDC052274]|uniref:lactate racemase domain-containing protein n=1 Tax=Actinoallomurus sp. NPDC052274 TaxID=3155420 RepID=UPI003416D953
MVQGTGGPQRTLTEEEIRRTVQDMLAGRDLDGRHVAVIIPDGTRSAPMPLMLRLLHDALAGRAARIDVLVALGTHQPMDDAALDALVGATGIGRDRLLPEMTVLNHAWSDPATYAALGTITAEQVRELSGGRLDSAVDVRINRLVVDADLVIVCGPVFPHEVVGFSGGNKYFFPGVAGPEVIDLSHWLGALITSHDIIGTRGITPVRAIIDHAAAMIPTPKLCLAMVVRPGGTDLAGLYAGTPEDAWAAAADLSARVHVRYVDRPYKTVLSVMPRRYADMWTAAKGMYKVEPVIADGGEVIVYAPHIDRFSVTHGAVLAEIGYHTRDYFLAQWDRFRDRPLGVLAHSTHLRGQGTFEAGVERPRINVTLATGIPEEVCAAHGLGYRDPATVDVDRWSTNPDPDVLVVPDAGEILYRLAARNTR